jgi:putative endonuclease
MTAWVYLMASSRYGYLYVGVTNDLTRRVHEHREGTSPGYSRQRQTHKLVYYEPFDNITTAIAREKQLKRYPRQWKFNLVDNFNLHWADLYPTLNR